MAKRKTSRTVPSPNELRLKLPKGRTPAEDTARLMVEGLAQNTLVMQLHSSMLPEIDTTEAFALTLSVTERVTKGDRLPLEAILAAQAIACNAIFTDCVKRARQNYGNAEIHDRLMRIGLRAQNQCRVTAESIALMQSPPAVFAKQANFAGGHQQVNNGVTVPPKPGHSRARAGNSHSQPIKLLEPATYVKRMDSGSSESATGGDPVVAPVGVINRAAKPRR